MFMSWLIVLPRPHIRWVAAFFIISGARNLLQRRTNAGSPGCQGLKVTFRAVTLNEKRALIEGWPESLDREIFHDEIQVRLLLCNRGGLDLPGYGADFSSRSE